MARGAPASSLGDLLCLQVWHTPNATPYLCTRLLRKAPHWPVVRSARFLLGKREGQMKKIEPKGHFLVPKMKLSPLSSQHLGRSNLHLSLLSTGLHNPQ